MLNTRRYVVRVPATLTDQMPTRHTKQCRVPGSAIDRSPKSRKGRIKIVWSALRPIPSRQRSSAVPPAVSGLT
jgi:hypothetical protein